VLEAAHIVPFLGKHTNSPDNALLLRADLHTLFDRELLSIDPTTLTVKVSGELGGSMYAAFSGRRVATAADSSEDSLRKRLLERIALFSNK
jgi:predicted restriction endonuclease